MLSFHLLELVERERLVEREQFWMDEHRRGGLFNICPNAGSPIGRTISEEHKRKAVAALRSPESVAKSASARVGMRHPESTKEKIRQTLLNRQRVAKVKVPPTAEELRERFERKSRKSTENNKKRSRETRAKISVANSNRVFSEETRAKMSAAASGRKLTEAQKEHLRRLQEAGPKCNAPSSVEASGPDGVLLFASMGEAARHGYPLRSVRRALEHGTHYRGMVWRRGT